jgi:hypothetical protein
MKKLIVTLLFLSQVILAQNKNNKRVISNSACANKVSYLPYKKKIPNGVCISKKYEIYCVNSEQDFNQDSIPDFYCCYSPSPSKDGDTTYIAFYNIVNGKAIFFKKFGNLKAIFFDYTKRRGKNLKDKYSETFEKYKYSNPEHDLEIKNDTITISCSSGEPYITKKLIYKYNNQLKDWVMVKSETIDGLLNTAESYSDKNIGKSITLFSYTYYLEEFED